ncbi:hypothetical protein [Anabaena azotica]|uniref:Uncharacterized protein n=1 Tax=Anabaena azotica FACHB-119 TaxID=947527 RepID=A0ABR8DF00_9NOST|nr:hypothetical protein [Anabaena azotica]MBD2505546.1 hypothetical protein [Anabaena azotica FACHB-119]
MSHNKDLILVKGDRKVSQTVRSPLFLMTTLWGATAQSLSFWRSRFYISHKQQ